MPQTFVLNDESVVNSYGFRTLNKGIDLKRFKKNPVLLDFHIGNNQRVLGKWTNIRIEGTQLLADIEFDEGDESAMKIAGKVERGYIKGCSMGINPARDSFQLEPTGTYLLTKCELMEASIVPIPSNANSIKMYASNGDIMDESQIKLSIETANTLENLNNPETMKKIMLSMAALMTLGIRDTEDQQLLETAITKLATDHEALKTEHKTLLESVEKTNKLNAETLVNQAIVDGKLSADLKEAWVKMGVNDFETTSKTIASMKGTTSLSGLVNNQGASEVKTAEDFQKLSAEGQLKFKNEQPEQYNKLFA